LNALKTAIYFSLNTPDTIRHQIFEASGVPSSQRYETYLGLLALVGKSRTKAFKGILDKIWRKLQYWKLKLLSQAGREIMLKAVVQAILTYYMSVFKLPQIIVW
jgi:hypothetical protein